MKSIEINRDLYNANNHDGFREEMCNQEHDRTETMEQIKDNSNGET